MVEALRIDGDDFSFDLLPAIERSFAVRLPDAALRHVVTAGDLHSLILQHVDQSGGEICATSHVFYALRRALVPFGLSPRARPGDAFAMPAVSPQTLRKALERATGFEMPPLVIGAAGFCGCLMMLVAGLVSVWFSGGWTLVVAVGLAIGFLVGSRQEWGIEARTLGGLTQSVVPRNHAALVEAGARQTTATIWNTLRRLIADERGCPVEDVEPTSRLMA